MKNDSEKTFQMKELREEKTKHTKYKKTPCLQAETLQVTSGL